MAKRHEMQAAGRADVVAIAAEKLRKGRNKDAAAILKRASRSSPGSAEVNLLYGIALLRLEKPKVALAPLEQAVGLEPQNPEACFYLGTTLRALGRLDDAADILARALAIKPNFGPGYRELGLVLLDAKMLDQASEYFQLAHQLDPADAESAFYCGIIEGKHNNAGAALEWYGLALKANSRHFGAHINRGNIAQKFGKFELAATSYRTAAEIEPDNPTPYSNLSRCLREAADYDGAEAAARKAIKLAPNLPDGHNNLGNVFKEKGQAADSLDCFRRALRIRPEEASIHYNLADAYHRLYDYPKARDSYQRALELDPAMAVAWNNLGLVWAEMGLWEKAYKSFERASELEPEHHGYRCAYSQSLESYARTSGHDGLLKRAYAMADSCFKSGLRTPNREFTIPRWVGEDVSDKKLLVWREQGLGDEIRFASQFEQLIEVAGHCTFEVDPRMVPVHERTFPEATFLPRSEDGKLSEAGYDYQIPGGDIEKMGFLGHYLYGERHQVEPWLSLDESRVLKWRSRLGELPGLKVGICWRSGLRDRLRDPHYSVLDEDWGDIFALPGVSLVTLQYGDCIAELLEAEARHDVRIERWDDLDLKDDLEDVLALIAGLDIVVSAPTAVAEMASAVAVPNYFLTHGAKEPNLPCYRSVEIARSYWQRHVSESWRDLIARLAASIAEDYLVAEAELAPRSRS